MRLWICFIVITIKIIIIPIVILIIVITPHSAIFFISIIPLHRSILSWGIRQQHALLSCGSQSEAGSNPTPTQGSNPAGDIDGENDGNDSDDDDDKVDDDDDADDDNVGDDDRDGKVPVHQGQDAQQTNLEEAAPNQPCFFYHCQQYFYCCCHRAIIVWPWSLLVAIRGVVYNRPRTNDNIAKACHMLQNISTALFLGLKIMDAATLTPNITLSSVE